MPRATDKLTRRSALRHLAVGAAIVPAVPYAALALTEPTDPIFAVIEAHKAALAEIADETTDETAFDAACEMAHALEEPLSSTVPTTAAGVVALLDHMGDREAAREGREDWPDAAVHRNAAAALRKLAA